MSAKPDFIIDKVKFDGVKVRIEFQRKRADDRYDEAWLASFDHPMRSFIAALIALAPDVCTICELPSDQVDKLQVRGVSFSHTNDIMGAVITALKPVKTAQSPVVLNTPHIPQAPYSDGGEGPLLDDDTADRLETLRDEAIRYINGEREQPQLDLQEPEERGSDEGVIEYATRLGVDFEVALTDPKNPVWQRFATRFTNCSITAGKRRLDIDADGCITATDL